MQAAQTAKAPAAPALNITSETILKVIEAHPDPDARTLLMASLDKMGAEAMKKREEYDAAQKKIDTLEKNLRDTERASKLNTAMLESTLSQFRSSLPESVRAEYPEELEKQAMTSDDANIGKSITTVTLTLFANLPPAGPNHSFFRRWFSSVCQSATGWTESRFLLWIVFVYFPLSLDR